MNEITGISNSVGPAWATPSYDVAGNMIRIPNLPVTITGTIPSWVPMTEALQIWRAGDVNPLMIECESRKISALTYPARLSVCLHRHDDTYTSSTLTEARHYYYTPGWQRVEEQVGTSTAVER